MGRILCIAAVCGSLFVLGVANASGDVPTPSDNTLEQVQYLSSTGSAFGQAEVVQIPVQEALDASRQPGFVSEGQPQTPLDVCWNNSGMWFSWGTWPYNQRVNESRYWCANRIGGQQTYRTSHVTLGGTFSLCDSHDAYGFRTTGGNGYTWTTFRSGGHFDCPSPIPWLTYHYHRWMEWACNTWGNCSLYDHSCTNCLGLSGGGEAPGVAARL
jgi:hypothetical protein